MQWHDIGKVIVGFYARGVTFTPIKGAQRGSGTKGGTFAKRVNSLDHVNAHKRIYCM